MDEWSLWVKNFCAPSPSDNTLRVIAGNEYDLHLLSHYRLPHVTRLIIHDPAILSADWAESYRPFAELVYRWEKSPDSNNKEDVVEWLIVKQQQNPKFLERWIFPFIDRQFASLISTLIESKANAISKKKSADSAFVKSFDNALNDAVGKECTGILFKDIINNMTFSGKKKNTYSGMPDYLLPLTEEWNAQLAPKYLDPVEAENTVAIASEVPEKNDTPSDIGNDGAMSSPENIEANNDSDLNQEPSPDRVHSATESDDLNQATD